jgi:hypothetical protein
MAELHHGAQARQIKNWLNLIGQKPGEASFSPLSDHPVLQHQVMVVHRARGALGNSKFCWSEDLAIYIAFIFLLRSLLVQK